MHTTSRPSRRSFEDTVVAFLGLHAGKIYAGLAVLAIAVVSLGKA